MNAKKIHSWGVRSYEDEDGQLRDWVDEDTHIALVDRYNDLVEQLEAVQRERDTLEDAIAAYAEASGVLVHSWPDDERERRRVALYSDTKFMRSALDEQADAIETLRTERDWWREQAVRGLEAGEVARLDYESLEYSPISTSKDGVAHTATRDASRRSGGGSEVAPEGHVRCPDCGASIAWEGESPQDCLRCGASFPASGEDAAAGQLNPDRPDSPEEPDWDEACEQYVRDTGAEPSPATCPDCKGFGMSDVETGEPSRVKTVSTEECFTCDGTGRVPSPAKRPT